MAQGAAGVELVLEVQRFLYTEAMLLDEGRYRDWLALLAEDVRYLMPTRPTGPPAPVPEGPPGPAPLAYFDEDRRGLELRVERLETGMGWAEVPPSRTQRLVTNVVVGDARAPASLDVRSGFLLYRTRLDAEVEIFCGHRDDVLRRAGDGFEIARRTVVLAANVLPGKNLSVFF